jgi:hypothetical protein
MNHGGSRTCPAQDQYTTRTLAVQRRARGYGRCAPRFRLDPPCCLH